MKIYHPRETHRNIRSLELRCMMTRHGHLQVERDLSAWWSRLLAQFGPYAEGIDCLDQMKWHGMIKVYYYQHL